MRIVYQKDVTPDAPFTGEERGDSYFRPLKSYGTSFTCAHAFHGIGIEFFSKRFYPLFHKYKLT